MKSFHMFGALALTLTLATGCTPADDEVVAADAPVTAARPQATSPAEVDAANVQRGTATGTITELDPAGSRIVIDHGPVPELQWPAMNMGFGATPAQVAQLEVGQSVQFDFEMAGNQAVITRIEPMQ